MSYEDQPAMGGSARGGLPPWAWIAIGVTAFLLVAYGITVSALAFLNREPVSRVPAAVSTPAPAPPVAPPTAPAAPAAGQPPTAPAIVRSPVPVASPTPVQTRTVYVAPRTEPANRPLRLSDLGAKPCSSLGDRGKSYYQMLEYWHQFGRPASMDIDHDGYPCETVYGDQN